MSMNKILFAAVLGLSFVSAPSVVYAEDGGEQKRGGKIAKLFERGDKNGDGVISKSEFLAQAEERFAKMDTDGNGEVSKEEAKAHAKKMRAKRKEMKDKHKDH